MGWFNKKSDFYYSTNNDGYQQQLDSCEKIQYEVLKDAAEFFLPEQEKWLEGFKEDHQKDFDSYSLECTRFGDFLTMNMVRNGKKYVSSLNLMNVSEISKYPGTAPSLNGSLMVYVSSIIFADGINKKDDYVYRYLNGTDTAYTVSKKLDKWNFYINPKSLIEIPEHHDSIHYHGRYNILNNQAASDAIDDRIYFRGIDPILTVPFGKMDEIYDIIIKEIGRGYERITNNGN